MNKNFGLIIDPVKETDFIFGDGRLGDSAINLTSDWSGWLPDYEPQSRPGAFDSFACVTFSTLNCVEILERKIYGATSNWSDRYLAKISGTDKIRGNSPGKVADTLKNKGCVPEKDLPFDITINSFETFYVTISDALYTLALAFKAEYSFGYSHVYSSASAIKEALKYSPVLFTVSAWFKDENGLYFRPQGETDGHATVCYGYEEGKYWKILDSYASDSGDFLKRVRWDSLPMQCKRFTLNRQIVVESAWSRFLKLLREILGYDK